MVKGVLIGIGSFTW